MIQVGINISKQNEARKKLVDAERNRRIINSFTFAGKLFDCDPDSRSNINGAVTLASLALGAGSSSKNKRWNGQDVDFTWLAQDNTEMVMDPETVVAFGSAAAEHVRAHIFAARTLKDMSTIPSDLTDDAYWA